MNPKPTPPDLPANLTIPQACERVFNISRSLYYKIPVADRPPIIHIGSKPFIRLADAINWLNSREAK